VCILPFVHIISGSFASLKEVLESEFILFPRRLSLEAYRYVFSTRTILRAMSVSVGLAVVGTAVNISLTSLMAYGLSRTQLRGRNAILFGVVFTMVFNGGMIPTYMVVRGLGLLDRYAALILPGAILGFNMIVMKNFYQQIPKELEETAKIDGANDLWIFAKVMVPLSMPAIATFSLFYAVGHWNQYFSAILYLNTPRKWPMQVVLRQIVILAEIGVGDTGAMDSEFAIPEQTVKMATIVVATIPILLLYPFLQRHFVKGVLLGSVKG
jgi:putative aldouronate transport system permease protein